MASGKRTLWIVLAACLGVVAMGVGLYGIVVGFQTEAEPGDRDRVVSAADFGFEADAAAEVLSRTRYIDGTLSIDYEYDLSDDGLYISCFHDREHTERSAREVYVGQIAAGGMLIEAFSDDVTVVDSSLTLGWGDQSSVEMIEVEGVEAGYKIDARKGKHVFNVIIMGVVFEPGELEEFLGVALERAVAMD